MIARPCLGCGEVISSGSHCTDCKPKDNRPRDHVAWRNNAKWKNLSKKLRRMSPFCEDCGNTSDLTVDHVIPVSVAPELAYSPENCRILCRSDNSRRQDKYTQDEVQAVIERLERAYKRRPTRKGRERIEAARRASDLGECPPIKIGPTDGKPQGAMKRGADALR